ncbi:hypothetical protein [Leekyejoonella antrihumi]|uniref:DUF3558 domain-containing protein n=1 Tax=Leekyejoonella antrihumi TaxID=1660198 RepID=A0A563DZQ8_9MICO|nr:hypothetical protein [Leekyejoonella antrihumi]TWP35124.1 hypothetical protein FGL98_15355 [Leekyejoonella antrihumi]
MIRARLTAAVVCACLAMTIAPAYAASTGPTTPASTAAPIRTQDTYSPPAAPPGAITPTPHVIIKPSNTFHVKVDPTGKKVMDDTWPDAAVVFTKAELAQALPGLTGVSAGDCQQIPVAKGGTSAHHEICTLTLRIPGEPNDDRSRLVVDVRDFGTADTIGRAWNAELAQERARAEKRPGLYTFFKNGSLGAVSSYTDGTTTRVLLAKGAVTGEIWFSGVGFTTLKSSYLASRQQYRQVIVPELVRLLAAKMHGS